MHRILTLLTPLVLCVSFSLHSEVIEREGNGYFECVEQQRILHLKGSPYEMGLQQGKLLKDLIWQNVRDFIDRKNPAMQSRVEAIQASLPKLIANIPERFCEEMRGVSEGSGVALNKIIALNIFPELFHCSGITLCDQATKGGELYHARVLDYGVGKNLQNTAVLMVVQPEDGHSFVNVSYAGFIGSVTGMNDQGIAMGEIGGWGYGYWDGMPMPFLFRDILERASSVEDAKKILIETPRTCEYYYIISDGKTRESLGVYATQSQIHFIPPGSAYALLAPKGLPTNYETQGDHDKFCMTSCALVRSSHQTLLLDSDKRVAVLYHQQPPSTILMTGFLHPERYSLLVDRVLASYGAIDENALKEIIKCPVARPTNLHNAIFLPSKLMLWVSHAGPNGEPACEQPYAAFKLSELLQ